VFPANPSLWRGLFEEGYGREDTRIRRLRTGRSAYAVTGLAPAEYLVAAVDEADMDGWPSEPFLERLRASAVRVQLFPGEHRAQPLVLKPSR